MLTAPAPMAARVQGRAGAENSCARPMPRSRALRDPPVHSSTALRMSVAAATYRSAVVVPSVITPVTLPAASRRGWPPSGRADPRPP